MRLDLGSLVKALASLRKALDRSEAAPGDAELRDAVIHRFGYSYELCWKMLERRLELDVPTPAAVDAMSFRELVREGAERGLVDDPERWMVYRLERNLTSQTYDEAKALDVCASVADFSRDARALLDALQKAGGA